MIESSKRCPNCGTENLPTDKFCANCGYSLTGEILTPKTMTEEEEKQAQNVGIIALLLYFLGSTALGAISAMLPEEVRPFLASMTGLCPMAGIGTMIYGRIKYPQSKFLKTVMWIILITIIAGIVLTIVVLISCIFACNSIVNDPSCG